MDKTGAGAAVVVAGQRFAGWLPERVQATGSCLLESRWRGSLDCRSEAVTAFVSCGLTWPAVAVVMTPGQLGGDSSGVLCVRLSEQWMLYVQYRVVPTQWIEISAG